MAGPTQPTATTIVTEALARYGVKSPTAAQISRAITQGLEYTKDLICLRSRKWNVLRFKSYYQVGPKQSIMRLPSDLGSITRIGVWDSDNYMLMGSPNVASQTTIKLNNSETRTASQLEGKWIVFDSTAGSELVGAGLVGVLPVYVSQIVRYTASTKSASVYPPVKYLGTTYSSYSILGYKTPVSVKMASEYLDDIHFPEIPGRPTQAYINDYTEWDTNAVVDINGTSVQFDYTTDKCYTFEILHHLDLQQIDLSDARYNNVLRKWKALLTQGVFVWLLEDNSDDRMINQQEKFGNMLSILGGQEIEGYDVSDLQRTVGE